jgi:hypothetical protein
MRTKHAAAGFGFLVLGLLTPGCSSPSGSTTPTNGTGVTFTVYGTVRGDADEGAKPLAGIEVTIAGDFDGDGTRSAAEVVKATTNASGFYSARVTVSKPTRLGIGWRGTDRLPNHKSFRVTGSSPLEVDVTLARGERFVAAGNRLELPGGGLSVEGLAAGVTGVGRLYNPALEAEFFPGDFRDDKGTPIVSASFATLEMQDANGAPLTKLDTPATLTMGVPRDTWGVVRDMQPGNGRIDVPKYWYDEAKGTWVQEGLGHLIDGAGRTLAEAELAALHNGAFEGEVAAVYEVTHFSTYNVDFPRATGLVGVQGKAGGDESWLDGIRRWFSGFDILGGGSGGNDKPSGKPPKPPKSSPKRDLQSFDAPRSNAFRSFTNPNLAPMAGALLHAEYYDAVGTPTGRATFEVADDGAFAVEAPRSEAPGEDLDDNGITGETFYVNVWAEWYGLRFHVVEGVVPSGAERVIAMGEIDLSSTLIEASRCRVEGTVRYLDGSAAAGAEVSFVPDRYADEDVFFSLCGADGALCSESATSGADGRFVFDYPRDQTFALDAFVARTEAPWDSEYTGRKAFFTCPAQPVVLTLRSAISYAAPAITVAGDRISWSGGFAVDRVFVTDSEGTLKWAVYGETSPIRAPVTYGVVPSGAVENAPAVGTIAAGDVVDIYGAARDPKGYAGRIEATFTVP